MKRWLPFLALACAPAFAAASPAPRTLEPRRLHLGVAGMPEWHEFESSTPHGAQLDLTFDARPNAQEATLLIRQRNVKTAWAVTLNGQRLGTLESLTQPLVRALRVPAGALRDGANQLRIARSPSRMLDDVVVGEITLDSRPMDEVLGAHPLTITVVDGASGQPLPSRITIVDAEGALAPFHPAPGQSLAVRTGVVYSVDGRASIAVPPGDYTVYASRGFEYGVAKRTLVMGGGENRSPAALRLEIRRQVPTPGFIAADTHIHTLTYAKHGDATIDERMLTIAGEGIELAVATDHNVHVDFTAPAQRAGVADRFRAVTGNEVSTKAGHFNAFPIRAGAPVPNAQLTDWSELLPHIRSVTGAQVIQLNHPRDVHSNFTPLAPANFDATTGELLRHATFDCDAMEVVTSAAMQSDPMLLFRDWFALLNHGYRIAAVGASDTHHVSEFILGQSRTYVASRADSPAEIDLDEVVASYRAGRLLVSFGLLTRMTVNDRFAVGDLATGSGELRVQVEVFGPDWVNADRVELFANGIRIREQVIAPTAEPLKARVAWTMPRPPHDAHLVAITTGPGVTGPFWEIPRPYQPSSKVFNPRVIGATNPIWIDGDGDGKFTAARGYATVLLERANGEPARLIASLASHDRAVAVQAADLWRLSGKAGVDAAMLERAPAHVREAFAAVAATAKPSQ